MQILKPQLHAVWVTAAFVTAVLMLAVRSNSQAQDVSATQGVAAGGDINAHDIIIKHGLDETEVAKLLQGLLEKDRKDESEIAKLLAEYAGKLSVTEAAVKRFFSILGEKEVPRDQLLEKFAEIAGRHLGIQAELGPQRVSDPDAEALRRQASRAFGAGDYDGAAALLATLQARQVQSLTAIQAQLDERKREVAITSFERGQIALAQLDYLKAAEHFESAVRLLPSEDRERRAFFQGQQAYALYRHGIERQDHGQALPRAIEIYRNLLAVYTRALPQQWAATQNNLGATLSDQGTRTSGEAGATLLAEAVRAYRAALEVYTREQLPQQWAATQNNLGTALKEQGVRTRGMVAQQLFREAIEAYRKALEVFNFPGLSAYADIVKGNLDEAQHLIAEQE
ncbi:MAG: hypothetical protein ACREWG_06990 [Gammaproteobacteria bacterium]